MSALLQKLPTFQDELKRALFLSVLTPVYNERHLVAESLRRVLALEDPRLDRLELIVVDDCSKDGSWEIVQEIAAADPRVKAIRHPHNQGKGAAIRTALANASGEVCLVHDADLEYHPGDIPALLRPFVEEGADAVFGSRYMTAPYRRVLMYRHSLINKFITAMANLATDLDLSDVETCYKLVSTALLRSFPLRSNDFRFEIEITMKLAKKHARIFEVPIRYLPRSYEEGKKIRAKDGVLALGALLKYSLVDDIVPPQVAHELQLARRYRHWLGHTLRPFLGQKVLEIGAGNAALTSQFIPRQLYVATDSDPEAMRYLRAYSLGKPYLRATALDPADPQAFALLAGEFDTVLLVNVLEHSERPADVLMNARTALQPGGRVVMVVPADPPAHHPGERARRRYTPAQLEDLLRTAGLEPEKQFDFNRSAVVAWNLSNRQVPKLQVKLLEMLMPLVRKAEPLLPWTGLNLIAVARR